eukprot:9492902-Pyramimonas_sp.AAC.1
MSRNCNAGKYTEKNTGAIDDDAAMLKAAGRLRLHSKDLEQRPPTGGALKLPLWPRRHSLRCPANST